MLVKRWLITYLFNLFIGITSPVEKKCHMYSSLDVRLHRAVFFAAAKIVALPFHFFLFCTHTKVIIESLILLFLLFFCISQNAWLNAYSEQVFSFSYNHNNSFSFVLDVMYNHGIYSTSTVKRRWRWANRACISLPLHRE